MKLSDAIRLIQGAREQAHQAMLRAQKDENVADVWSFLFEWGHVRAYDHVLRLLLKSGEYVADEEVGS